MAHPIVKLGHIAKVKGGKRLPLGDELVHEKTAHPYVRARDIRDGKVTFDDPVYVTDDIFQKIKNYTVKANDVCITIVGANVGDVGIIPPFLDGANLTENAVKLTELKDCDPFFLNFSLLGSEPQGQMKQYAAGAAQPKLGIYKVNEIDIPFPPLETQRTIASILSAYDDLIENNDRRIKILEEMARMLYREWFVNFRFPGHEKVRMVDSSLGLIPEGWEVKVLEELVDEHIGGGWGKEDPEEKFTEPAWVIRGTDIPDARYCQTKGVPFRYHTSSNLRTRKLEVGDIIFEVSGGSKGQPVGRSLLFTKQLQSAFAGDAVICASFCKRVKPKKKTYYSEILYLSFVEGYTSGEIEEYQVQSTGISNFKWTEYLQQTQRVVPPQEMQERFCNVVSPMFAHIATLGLKSANLRKTRDLLLPKLISGEIEV